MTKVVIYTTTICPYCVWAKDLLSKKGVAFTEINISEEHSLIDEMIEKSDGKRSVPQIFIGDYHVGGYDDLVALNNAGKLDDLLV